MAAQTSIAPVSRFAIFSKSINAAVVFVFLLLIPLMSHAGGLGIAPLAAIIGAVGWLTRPNKSYKKWPAYKLCLFVFLGWAAITSLWSPYQSGDFLTNPIKLLLGVGLFLGCIDSLRRSRDALPVMLPHLFIAINVFACGLIIFDGLSAYGLTYLLDPLREGEDNIRKLADAEMNIGHSVTVLLLFLGPVMALMMQRIKHGWAMALLYVVLLLWAARLSGLAVGVLSALVVLAALILSVVVPRFAFKLSVGVAICAVLFAPLIGILSASLPQAWVERLPLSWEHRVVMWDYTASKIWEMPLLGHGFDAVRSFDATMTLGVVDNWRIVSLHPHNAGLHIWVETGLIGVGLSCVALYLIGARLLPLVERSTAFAMGVTGLITAASIISSVTYGVWQDWWWASIILASASLNLLSYKHSLILSPDNMKT